MGKVDKVDQETIKLVNHSISEAIDEKVRDRIHELVINQGTFTEYTELLKAVTTVEDSTQRAVLLREYTRIIAQNQSVKNEVLKGGAEADIELKKERAKAKQDLEEKILSAELEKSKSRLKLFNNRAIILIFMCFPIVAGFILISWKEAYFFAFLVMVMWYGMSLALYFSQANALGDLIKVFNEKDGLLNQFRKKMPNS